MNVVYQSYIFFKKLKNEILKYLNGFYVQGQYIGITGQVGSGKSSLLHAILAEMEKETGFVAAPDFESGILIFLNSLLIQ